MLNRVQAKSKKVDTIVFHFGLIKMLVREELRKTNIVWENFLTSSHFHLDISPTPQTKRQIPTPVERNVHSKANKKKRVTRSDKIVKATNEAKIGGPSQPPYRETSPMVDPIPMDIPSIKPRGLKGKKHVFSPAIVADKVKPRRPFTRATAKQHVLVKDYTKDTLAQQKGKYHYSK
jgi:hypothetical protein